MHGVSLSASYRLGKPENLERSEGRDLGLRVMLGHRQAMVSTTDFAEDALVSLVERALAMARAVPEDPYCGLIESEQLAREWPDLELADAHEPEAEQLIERARRAEEAARAVPGVTNSEGGDAGWMDVVNVYSSICNVHTSYLHGHEIPICTLETYSTQTQP